MLLSSSLEWAINQSRPPTLIDMERKKTQNDSKKLKGENREKNHRIKKLKAGITIR